MSACLGKCEVGSLCPVCDPTKVILAKEADLLMAFYAACAGNAKEARARLKAILEERPYVGPLVKQGEQA